MKIGVFDSGIGGITVLSKLRETIPQADYVYLGDTANLPYGTKSPAHVTQLSLACAEKLRAQGVDAVVVACNTASSLALDAVRVFFGEIPVYGVVEPGARAAAGAVDTGSPVLVLATRSTVKSGAYSQALRAILPRTFQASKEESVIYEQACPLLVPMIDEGWTDHAVLHRTLEEDVAPYRAKHPNGVALLGCTHYPWIQAAVEKALPGWKVVNSAQALSDSLKSEFQSRIPNRRHGGVEWIFTDPDALPEFARTWIDRLKEQVQEQMKDSVYD